MMPMCLSKNKLFMDALNLAFENTASKLDESFRVTERWCLHRGSKKAGEMQGFKFLRVSASPSSSASTSSPSSPSALKLRKLDNIPRVKETRDLNSSSGNPRKTCDNVSCRASSSSSSSSSPVSASSSSALVDRHSHAESLDNDQGSSMETSDLNSRSGFDDLGISTEILNFPNTFDPFDALSTPLYQTATFKQPSATENGAYDYTRSGNPTRTALEALLAKLEGADRAFCFNSGMAALATVTHLARTGDEIVTGDDIYGGSDRLLSQVAPRAGLVVKRVDTSNLQEVEAAIGPKTKLVWLESPTNPRLMVCNIREISKIAHQQEAVVMVDNSIMSPVLSKPLELGADIVMHSATKFIAGHSDLMAGVLAVKGERLAKDIYFLQNAEGTGLAPFDCWLCLRGIKTMALRVEKQQCNAQKIAEFLVSHPRVKKVNYAGLPGHPGRDLHFSQAKGAGSVLSFTTGSLEVSKHVVENTKLFSITVSFGSVKSLISLPCFMSHASIPADVRESRGLTEDLIRLSVGIEDVDDLILDLEQALSTAPTSSKL